MRSAALTCLSPFQKCVLSSIRSSRLAQSSAVFGQILLGDEELARVELHGVQAICDALAGRDAEIVHEVRDVGERALFILVEKKHHVRSQRHVAQIGVGVEIHGGRERRSVKSTNSPLPSARNRPVRWMASAFTNSPADAVFRADWRELAGLS